MAPSGELAQSSGGLGNQARAPGGHGVAVCGGRMQMENPQGGRLLRGVPAITITTTLGWCERVCLPRVAPGTAQPCREQGQAWQARV